MFNFRQKFDFKISISNHIVSVAPGKQISIPVRVERLHGDEQQIDLDINTHWESVGLSAKIAFDKLTPGTEWQATMMVKASHNTPPGSYLFTVRGGTKGTFKTSEDAVTVIVDPKAEQKEDEKDNVQPKQATTAAEPSSSFSLDKLFTPKSDDASEKLSSVEKAKIKKQMSMGSTVGLVLGFVILAIILGVVLSSNIGDNTNTTGTTGKTRWCIMRVLGNPLPDCSDYNGQPEPTTLNSHNLGICRVVSNSGCAQR
jgi:hypothetical protein